MRNWVATFFKAEIKAGIDVARSRAMVTQILLQMEPFGECEPERRRFNAPFAHQGQ